MNWRYIGITNMNKDFQDALSLIRSARCQEKIPIWRTLKRIILKGNSLFICYNTLLTAKLII